MLFTDQNPEGATQFAPSKWGCVAAMHTAAAKGRTVVFDRQTHGCPGGGVNFLANPDQLSALVVLANYGRTTTDNVTAPMGAGCQSVCLLPHREPMREPPRAVIGMFDISARPHVDRDLLSFSVPFRMLQEMESNVAGSFLDHRSWQKVRERIA